MAIGSAIERGSLICVYDEHGHTLFPKARGSGPTTDCWDSPAPPSPRAIGSTIFTYDEHGHDDLREIGVIPARADHTEQLATARPGRSGWPPWSAPIKIREALVQRASTATLPAHLRPPLLGRSVPSASGGQTGRRTQNTVSAY